MLEVLKAIKKIIEKRIVNIQPLTIAAPIGATQLTVQNAKRFNCGDEIVIYPDGSQVAEKCTLIKAIDWHTLLLESPLKSNHEIGEKVQVVFNNQWVKGVYIGDPQVIPQYPAVTVDMSGTSDDWITLNSITRQFNVDITVYTTSDNYERNYEYMLKLASQLQDTLYKNFYPLVEPFALTYLTEDVEENDTLIRVENDDLIREFAWFWIENDRYTRHFKPKKYLGNGVIELVQPTEVPFLAGDEVIFPTRHIYDTRTTSIDTGRVVKGESGFLNAARISYFGKEERLIPNPYFLPLNR